MNPDHFRAAQRQYDNASPYDDAAEARNEALAERTDALVEERLDDAKAVAAAIDEIAGTSDHNDEGNTLFAAELARVLTCSDAAFEAEAVQFFAQLRIKVRDELRPDAETDAAAEIARFEGEGEEMRDLYRNRGWAA